MNNLNSSTRLGTMVVDHFFTVMIIMIIVAPGMVYDIIQAASNPEAPPKLMMGNIFLNVFGFSLYFNKDLYSGRSIAKRLFKLQVVDLKTNKPANALKCFIRNITIIIWPIEVIVALSNSERRLGDRLAGTKLTTYDAEQHRASHHSVTLILALIISPLFTYFTMFFPIQFMLRNSGLEL